MRDCVRCYTSDYTTVSRRYESYANQHWEGEDRDATLKSTPKQDYEVDVDESQSEYQQDQVKLE